MHIRDLDDLIRRLHHRNVALTCCLMFCTFAASTDAATPVPGRDPGHPIALVGGTIHPVVGTTIENGTLIIEAGKIVAVTANGGLGGATDRLLGSEHATIPRGTEIIAVDGLHIYPGLFHPLTDLGLIEIDAVRATRDQAEVGPLNPNARAEVAVNPDSERIPVTRSNGVLLATVAPQGRFMQGSSALLQLDGWTWEDMTRDAPLAIHMAWPFDRLPTDDEIEEEHDEAPDRLTEQLELLRNLFERARLYHQTKASQLTDDEHEPFTVDLRLEGMLPLLQRSIPLVVEADRREQIEAAVAFAAEQDVRLVIAGGYDAVACADLLKRWNVPVIVTAVYRLPARRHDPYDDSYTLPARLHAKGVTYCIGGGSRFESSNARNLPYHAATAVAYGLSADEALRAITLYPAQIYGVDDHVGSLEPGKDATLIVTDGDPLETPTHVLRAFVQGRPVDLDDKQKRLWHKYQRKYETAADREPNDDASRDNPRDLFDR